MCLKLFLSFILYNPEYRLILRYEKKVLSTKTENILEKIRIRRLRTAG